MGAAAAVRAIADERPVDRLLGRLDAVRQTALDRWQARCPSHDDRHPSLSVRETGDGTVLVKCWTGCPVGDVLAAVGLELRDLFSQRLDHHRAPLPRGQRFVPREALAALVHEICAVQIAASDLARGGALDDARRERLRLAAARLSAAAEAVS
jgi:hypothetical protein